MSIFTHSHHDPDDDFGDGFALGFSASGTDFDPQRPRTTCPVALTIAGSDSSGGAGVQADLKTFSALGAYGMSAITALTAQNTRGVASVHFPPVSFLREQLDAVASDIRIDAIKIGMLATAEIAATVSEWLDAYVADHPAVSDAIVLDPVMVATSGDPLIDEDAIVALQHLIPRVSLITPNLPEAARLLGTTPAEFISEMHGQASALLSLGAQRVLLKGGHRTSDPLATDVFVGDGVLSDFTTRRVRTKNTHGTGCSLSSALAALRPQCPDWTTTVRAAKDWLTGALEHAGELHVGSGHGPVHHFHQLWPHLPLPAALDSIEES